MNLQEAYKLMDLLLDKSDQPYFTDEEKNMFLDQSIMSFIKPSIDSKIFTSPNPKTLPKPSAAN